MTTTTITENVFNDEFLSPSLCSSLVLLGITEAVPYHFKMGADFCLPFTYVYDTDNIYAQMDANVFCTDAVKRIPAYRIKDLERVFDGYTIVKKDRNHYQMAMMHINKTYSVSDERMPDCFGKMILELLQRKIIEPGVLNDKMTRL